MGFLEEKPKKNRGLYYNEYDPEAWRKNIRHNPVYDSHIWDRGVRDCDGDGYRDGSVGDGGLWDD